MHANQNLSAVSLDVWEFGSNKSDANYFNKKIHIKRF